MYLNFYTTTPPLPPTSPMRIKICKNMMPRHSSVSVVQLKNVLEAKNFCSLNSLTSLHESLESNHKGNATCLNALPLGDNNW